MALYQFSRGVCLIIFLVRYQNKNFKLNWVLVMILLCVLAVACMHKRGIDHLNWHLRIVWTRWEGFFTFSYKKKLLLVVIRAVRVSTRNKEGFSRLFISSSLDTLKDYVITN